MFWNLIRPFLTWPAIQSLVRHGLTSGGAILISKGLASGGDTEAAIGALMAIIGFGHSVWQKWQSFKSASTAQGSMKIPILFLPIAVALAIGVTACSTPQRVTYQTVATTVVTVDAAMSEWGAYVASNHPGTNAEAAVAAAYVKYQNSMAIVCDAGEVYSSTSGTNATAVAALDQAIANSSQELTDLENLISSFGVHLQ